MEQTKRFPLYVPVVVVLLGAVLVVTLALAGAIVNTFLSDAGDRPAQVERPAAAAPSAPPADTAG